MDCCHLMCCQTRSFSALLKYLCTTPADLFNWSAVPEPRSVISMLWAEENPTLSTSPDHHTVTHLYALYINKFIYTAAGLECSHRCLSSSCWIHCWQWMVWVGSQSLYLPWPSPLTKHKDVIHNHKENTIEIMCTFFRACFKGSMWLIILYEIICCDVFKTCNLHWLKILIFDIEFVFFMRKLI